MAELLDLDAIRDRLKPMVPAFIESHLRAWEIWRQLQTTPFALPLEAADRASFVHRHVCRELGIRLTALGYVIARPLGFNTLSVHPDLLIRFKFVRHGQPHNIQTLQQQLLQQQSYKPEGMESLLLDGFSEPPTFLTAAWTLDHRGTEISEIMVRRDCLGSDTIQWTIYPDDNFNEPLPLPNIPQPLGPRISSSRSLKHRITRSTTDGA